MTDEKWQDFIETAKKHFNGVRVYKEDLFMDTPDGQVKQGTKDVLEFSRGDEQFRLVRENRPVVLGKKELYSTRAGQSAQVQYKFSETDFSHKLRVYKEKDLDEWEEVTLDKLGL